MSNFHPLEVVGRCSQNVCLNIKTCKCFFLKLYNTIKSETQLQVVENLNYLMQRYLSGLPCYDIPVAMGALAPQLT